MLLEKLNESLAFGSAPPRTRRDARLPGVPGKVHAVTGMRRAGRTTFLRQLLADRRKEESPELSVFVSFDDDRLAGVDSGQLSLLLEEYFRRYPETRGRKTIHLFLDEIQLVPGWEQFVRRVVDTELAEIVVSGSSAKMLSREVHTSLRGRGMETVIRPFGFREFLRHRGEEPVKEPARWTSAGRSLVEKRFLEFLVEGGFPEAQGLDGTLRIELLQGYVDTVLFRDVVERHGISQVAALRWLVRQCLRNPAGAFSAHRLYLDLEVQGLGVAKDAVHEMLEHLTDAFLLTAVPIATDSERRRNSNPRKVYPADQGLIAAFDTARRANVGRALETVVAIELDRRRAVMGYVKTGAGFEVDFLARGLAGSEELIQVCADPSALETKDRALRALVEASAEHPRAKKALLVLTRDQVFPGEAGIEVRPVYEWLLSAGS